jgi:hypothetical protein
VQAASSTPSPCRGSPSGCRWSPSRPRSTSGPAALAS